MDRQARQVQALLDKYERVISQGFIQTVSQLRDVVTLQKIAHALESGDLQAAYAAVGLGAWTPLTEAGRLAYLAGGVSLARGFVFDMNNPRAVRWMNDHSSTMITEMTKERQEVIAQVLSKKLDIGINGKQGAVLLMGRWDGIQKRRVGGLVGLHSHQARYVLNMMAELQDPKRMSNYFTRERRDRRFDSIVSRALENKKPVPRADIERISARYADRLLRLRAQTIGRTEATAAFNAAREESARQAVDNNLIEANKVRRIWDATLDSRTRNSHARANGQKRGLNEPFRVGGALLMFPGDPRGPASQTANCRCFLRIVGAW